MTRIPHTAIVRILLAMAATMCVSAASAGAAEPAVYAPNPKPPTDGLIGTNYTPAYAVNQVQFWHDFRPAVVDRELAAAKKHFGIATLRVYLHSINFFAEKKVFLANIEHFLAICETHGIRPGFVFFDGCHRREGIFLDRPTEPVAGYHNGRWAQCPQAREIEKDNLEKFKPYVQEVIRPRRRDRRVLFWEIHNEPPPGDTYRDRLKRAGYRWAKEVGPVQPVLNCEKGSGIGWGDCAAGDIVDAHVYLHNDGPLRRLAEANPNKGTVFTEAGARWKALIRNFGDPCGMIHWLNRRRNSGRSTPGMYLCWELMVGNSNCRWHWRDKPGAPEPEIPWCGLLWPDCTPVSLAEAEAIRRYTTGESRAMLYANFEHAAPGWKPFGTDRLAVVNALRMTPDTKAIAGEAGWDNYILEGTVAVVPRKGAASGAAGLLFRVSEPGDGLDDMRGYGVTCDTDRKLILSKFTGGARTPLATFDLATLKTETRLGEWSMIRVAVTGPRIRVWCNRMHPSADPDRGLRIDYTDENDPLLTGAVGVCARGVHTMNDNVVVLPAGERGAHGWRQSYRAGYTDERGRYAGGSEIMHIVPHTGKLFAFNGYWKDRHFGTRSSQVLRLDAPDAAWQVDLETTKENLGYTRGNILHLKGNILKSVTFTTDRERNTADATLLVAASWAFNINEQGHQATSVFVRDDETGTWRHTLLVEGPRDMRFDGGPPRTVRRVPRDMAVYRDPVTGIDRLFLLVGDLGIISGAYDAATGRIAWDEAPEFPAGGALKTRPLGIAAANGRLYFSVGGRIYVRTNGPKPSWSKAYAVSGRVNTELGGIRGLTAIDNPGGPGESLIFVWTPRGRSPGQIVRLDGVELKESKETTLRKLFDNLSIDNTRSTGSLGGYNRFFPVTDPRTGNTVHLVGAEQTIETADDAIRWNRYYKGALYGIRIAPDRYTSGEVNGRWAPSKPVLVAPRAFAHSPFSGEKDVIYIGGHDCNFHESTDMAWIFKADVHTVMGCE